MSRALAAVLTVASAPLVSSSNGALQAQGTAQLLIELPQEALLGSEGPLVRAPAVLSDARVQELVKNGFPARLHYRVELWAVGRIFNDLRTAYDWDVVIRYEPLERELRVARVEGDRATLLGRYEDFSAAQDAVSRAFRVPITPGGGGRFYYAATLDVEILSLSDLDEVERWLRGELRPAVRGERSPGTALTRGLRQLAVRVLGGERKHYDARTGTFRQ